jgi:acylphosphatase
LEESPDMTAAAVRRRVIVRGRVQGVFFRDSLRRRAEERGVTGWVRNRLDGAVEAVFEGPPDGVDALVRFAETGPPQARVESVETTDERVGGETEFRVR